MGDLAHARGRAEHAACSSWIALAGQPADVIEHGASGNSRAGIAAQFE